MLSSSISMIVLYVVKLVGVGCKICIILRDGVCYDGRYNVEQNLGICALK